MTERKSSVVELASGRFEATRVKSGGWSVKIFSDPVAACDWAGVDEVTE